MQIKLAFEELDMERSMIVEIRLTKIYNERFNSNKTTRV